jgi:DNA-binding transcriptional regulator LsrR (DeoR family)
VPFIADSPTDRKVLVSQRAVSKPLKLANRAKLSLISIGELAEHSLLRQQRMITQSDLRSLRKTGAVGDTTGTFFDMKGQAVDHPLNQRTLSVDFSALKQSNTVVLSAGLEKIEALRALLASGVISGLIIDGDSAMALAQSL